MSSTVLVKPKAKYIDVNEFLTLRVIQLNRQRNGESMLPAAVNQLRTAIEHLNILPYGETPTFITFIQAKRSFVIRTNAARFYLLTAYLKQNVSWIYEVRRSLGQSKCCARAHSTNQGLPDIKLERTYQTAFNAFLGSNMLPCQKHFLEHLSDPFAYIRDTVRNNSIRIDEAETTETTKITYRILIQLIAGNRPYSAALTPSEINEMVELELQHMRITQLNDIGTVMKECREIIEEIDERYGDEDPEIDTVTLEALGDSVDGSLAALEKLQLQIQQGVASADSGRLYKNMEVIKTIQRQIQSVQFSMSII